MTEELKRWADGDPERRKIGWHDEVIEQLDKHADRIEGRLQRFFRRALIAIAVVGLFTAVSLVGYGILLREQHQTTTLIQTQRRDSIRMSCEDQNSRHDRTIAVLDKVFEKVLKTVNDPDQKTQIAASKAYNVLLINALAPKQNCDNLVKIAVPKVTP